MTYGIGAIGMVSSVGPDARTTCASVRAGVQRPQALLGWAVPDPASRELEAVSGHPVSALTDGFAAPARWLRLGAAALTDLKRAVLEAGDERRWEEAALVVVTPELDDARFMFEPACRPEAVRRHFVEPLLRHVGRTPESMRCLFVPAGRVAPFHMLTDLKALLYHLQTPRFVLLAVDSWLDGMSLAWLSEQGRLHTADRPGGLVPGEAAGALLLEPFEGGAAPMAVLAASGIGEEPDASGGSEQEPPLFEVAATGTALAVAMGGCLERAGRPDGAFDGTLYADLNGEAWRGRDLGTALHRLAVRWPLHGEVHLPASSLGDVGSAASVLSLALAARALEHGYATGGAVLTVGRDEAGAAGACLLVQAAAH